MAHAKMIRRSALSYREVNIFKDLAGENIIVIEDIYTNDLLIARWGVNKTTLKNKVKQIRKKECY